MAHHPCYTFLARYISSFSPSSKVPLLWKTEADSATSISTLQLLSWGRGGSGQLGGGDGGRLGFGHENPAFVPTPNPNLDCVRSTALSGIYSAALTTLGDVYTWGYGGFGALGHRVYTRELLPRMILSPRPRPLCPVLKPSDLYTWGRDEGDGRLGLGSGRGPNEGGGLSIPSKVNALPVPMAAVSCGGFFTMGLTKQGQLWNWGGKEFYFCFLYEGKVLSWGHGGHGQLGHSSIENQKVPVLVEALAGENIIYILCGGSTSAAVTDKGKLYMWGNARDLSTWDSWIA
ncbi:Regulator of chromosome condensation [Macleaya cordata]|uniref:Regulator of chromosome condensation n=1 Tax=Macleaya cordata TaxID=56857 RepID=A0A200Q994_MACCD|nr:Regulator of chromosome condensation [Macleaya cordata]